MAYVRTQRRFNSRPRQPMMARDRFCYFCREQVDTIDYKNVALLQKFLSSYFKILPRKRTGVCMTHQRKLGNAIKRARTIALLPFVPE